MRHLRLFSLTLVVTVASLTGLSAWLSVHAADSAADQPAQSTRIERVTVVGQRLGNLRNLLAGYTFRGTEGFVDGSAPEERDNRTAFPWEVYYSPDGRLEAHFRRIGARVPHAKMEELDYVDYGSWTIDDGDLCQSIPRVASGSTVCFEMRRTSQTKLQMYYTRCGAMNRCYPGRLGPDGELFPGRVFTR